MRAIVLQSGRRSPRIRPPYRGSHGSTTSDMLPGKWRPGTTADGFSGLRLVYLDREIAGRDGVRRFENG